MKGLPEDLPRLRAEASFVDLRIMEAFLLEREGREADPLFALRERGVIRIALDVQEG